MIIREYQPSDADYIIKNIPSKYPKKRAEQLKIVENCQSYNCFVAEEGVIKGFVIFQDLGDKQSYYIVQITVAELKKGIGTKLMKQVFAAVGQGGQVSLNVNTTNSAAIVFYEKLGFEKSGETKDYIKGEDKYWYKKVL